MTQHPTKSVHNARTCTSLIDSLSCGVLAIVVGDLLVPFVNRNDYVERQKYISLIFLFKLSGYEGKCFLNCFRQNQITNRRAVRIGGEKKI